MWNIDRFIKRSLVIHCQRHSTETRQISRTKLNIQSVPRSKHTAGSVIKTSQLMLYREIIAVCSVIHAKHINTLCGQNAECPNVKPGVTHSSHLPLRLPVQLWASPGTEGTRCRTSSIPVRHGLSPTSSVLTAEPPSAVGWQDTAVE